MIQITGKQYKKKQIGVICARQTGMVALENLEIHEKPQRKSAKVDNRPEEKWL